MDSQLREFLETHPTNATWLSDIINTMVDMGGATHVSKIAHELSRSRKRDINSIEETVTRRINDFCSNAADFKKGKESDLFERVEPGTYRLRSYPAKPDILNLIHVKFEDTTTQFLWETYQNRPNLKAANERKLVAFAKWVSKSKELYDQIRAVIDSHDAAA